MNTLAALRRAQAFEIARAVPKTSLRHIDLDDNPMVITLNVLAGEPFAPLGLTWGTDPSEPAGYTVIPEPRNRDLRYAGLAEFGRPLASTSLRTWPTPSRRRTEARRIRTAAPARRSSSRTPPPRRRSS
jgi:hypothetical protein